MLKDNKTLIIIVGPTAAGKTAIAIEMAEYYKTEIISADSRQCFKELNIGVARPSEKELEQVPHYFIASHSIHEEVNAMVFEQYALDKVSKIFKTNDVAVMVGGTGLYIKAFCESMDNIPVVSPEIRKKITAKFHNEGLEWLQREVEQKDREFYRVGEIQNPQRLLRALEVIESTGKSVLHFRKGKKAERDFNIIKIGFEVPGAELHQNINVRVDKMIERGLIEEVTALRSYKHLNALQTVGYNEIFDYIEGKNSMEEAIELIKKNTRQYAKRQTTWFKKDKDIQWFDQAGIEKVKGHLDNVLT